jgi:hypothetical protein
MREIVSERVQYSIAYLAADQPLGTPLETEMRLTRYGGYGTTVTLSREVGWLHACSHRVDDARLVYESC